MTPTQDLLLEVLAARIRMGERFWTFDKRHAKALNQLADKGLVNVMHGIVQGTVRAALTKKGMAEYLDENYVPPVLAREA